MRIPRVFLGKELRPYPRSFISKSEPLLLEIKCVSKKETVSATFTANVNRVAIPASQIVTKGGFRMSDETLGSLCLEN